MAEVPTIAVQGMALAQLTRHQVVDHVFGALARGRGGWIVTPNVDYLRRFVQDAETRELLAAADLLVADGIPLLWAARLQGTPLPDRVAGSDLIWLFAERAARDGRSLFLLGGNPGAADAAAARLRARWPALRIAGTDCPRVSPRPTHADLAPVRQRLQAARPDLVLAAFGAPKEERLIATLRDALPDTWWIGVGISFSFVAGEVRRAPRWMHSLGLEWLHRLSKEPRRLARRYLVEDLPFATRLLVSARRRRRV